jgi:hypothetical protein
MACSIDHKETETKKIIFIVIIIKLNYIVSFYEGIFYFITNSLRVHLIKVNREDVIYPSVSLCLLGALCYVCTM